MLVAFNISVAGKVKGKGPKGTGRRNTPVQIALPPVSSASLPPPPVFGLPPPLASASPPPPASGLPPPPASQGGDGAVPEVDGLPGDADSGTGTHNTSNGLAPSDHSP